jgi:hypothetical protein
LLFKVVGIYRDTLKEEPDIQTKTELQVVFIHKLKLTNAEDKNEQVCQNFGGILMKDLFSKLCVIGFEIQCSVEMYGQIFNLNIAKVFFVILL